MNIPGRKTILVTGVTGRQGGAVARALLGSKGRWHVHGLTRDASSPAARAVAELGVELVEGDLDDRASLEAALRGAYGAYAVQATDYGEEAAAREVRQGCTFADAVKAAGVEHLVYSSVGGAERSTGIPHFDSKWQIEQYIRKLSLPATVLRPTFFMDNWLTEQNRRMIGEGRLVLAIRPETKLQQVAVRDIGAFAALAFEHPDEHIGKALELAGDELTMPQTAEGFARWLGRPVRYDPMPMSKMRELSADLAVMQEWFDREGYRADIESLRAVYPPLLNFRTWLKEVQYAPAEHSTAGTR